MSLDDLSYEYGEDNIYCYPNSSILKNKQGIRDAKELSEYERKITFIKGAELDKHPLKGDLNFAYLKQIHKFLFEDIYDWAGQIRRVDISKGNTFCLHEYIEESAKNLFDELKSENYLSDLNFDQMCERLAYYLGEINSIHPFREGNGRTQRLFLRALAARNGYTLNFGGTTRPEMIKASDASFRHDYIPLQEIIAKSLSTK